MAGSDEFLEEELGVKPGLVDAVDLLTVLSFAFVFLTAEEGLDWRRIAMLILQLLKWRW